MNQYIEDSMFVYTPLSERMFHKSMVFLSIIEFISGIQNYLELKGINRAGIASKSGSNLLLQKFGERKQDFILLLQKFEEGSCSQNCI